MSLNSEQNYIGKELDLFAYAHNWKAYWSKMIEPFMGKNILEVGAGIGTNTKFFLQGDLQINKWTCLEPDIKLAEHIASKIAKSQQSKVTICTQTLEEFRSEEKFDTILYIDVLEHIESDRAEIELAKDYLIPGGHLIILVPAHNFLYSEFDKSIGHFRRYDKKMMRNVVDERLKEEQLMYLDTVGMVSSMMNKVFLRQSYPTLKQIKFWDNFIVRTSKYCDVLLRYNLGKSLLGIWKKSNI